MQILVINNHKGQSNFIRQGLRYENFGTDVCFNETDGLTKLLYHNYNAIILKHSPPELDSTQLIKQIQNLTPSIPTIILSAINTPDLQERIRSFKNTVLLIQPFSFYRLCQHIKELSLKYFPLKKTKELKIKDLVLNLDTREASRRNKSYFLRNKEFSLLEFLMLNHGKVLSRSEILEGVWDRNISILTNTVDVHINNLRKKVDENSGKKLIRTIHGIGYMFG